MNQKLAEHVEPGAAIVYQDSQGGTGAVLVKTVNREVAQPRCLFSARLEATDIYGVVWDVTISTREDPHEATHVTEMVAGAEKMTVLGITNCKRGACRLDRVKPEPEPAGSAGIMSEAQSTLFFGSGPSSRVE